MKIIHLNYSDIVGGAARGAYRVHHCLRSSGVDSCMWVNQSVSEDSTVEMPLSKFERMITKKENQHIVDSKVYHILNFPYNFYENYAFSEFEDFKSVSLTILEIV